MTESDVPSSSGGAPLPDARETAVFEPRLIQDDRGWFYEAFNENEFASAIGQTVRFVQDNQSRSIRGVLRGLHYQVAPMAQGKLVRVVQGAIFDVAVDLRGSSPLFGTWVGTELSETNFKQMWIPPGFAHGFLALTDHADVVYKVTEYHSPAHERSVRWDDHEIGIEWPLDGPPILSERDAEAPRLSEADVFE